MGTFHTITDADWEKSLRRARSETNSIMEKLQMKLKPKNPTPGINPSPEEPLAWRDELQPPPHRWGAYWLHPDGWYRLYEPNQKKDQK